MFEEIKMRIFFILALMISFILPVYADTVLFMKPVTKEIEKSDANKIIKNLESTVSSKLNSVSYKDVSKAKLKKFGKCGMKPECWSENATDEDFQYVLLSLISMDEDEEVTVRLVLINIEDEEVVDDSSKTYDYADDANEKAIFAQIKKMSAFSEIKGESENESIENERAIALLERERAKREAEKIEQSSRNSSITQGERDKRIEEARRKMEQQILRKEEERVAAELKAEQEAEARRKVELKAKQEAEERREIKLKAEIAKREAERKAMEERKAKVGGNLYWSSLPPKDLQMDWDESVAYCRNLREGGFSDWRLPTIDELRTLIQNCKATQTGGACNIYNAYRNDNGYCRKGCAQDNSYDSAGKYSKLGDDNMSLPSINTCAQCCAWNVFFGNGSIECMGKSGRAPHVRCVRRAN